MDYWIMRFDTPLTLLLVLIGFILVVFAQIKINSAYSKYSKIKSLKGVTGKDIARKLLDSNNLSQIQIYETSGKLTDHYNPMKKSINLSSEVYNGNSIASVAVAAHECGHAIQDKDNYFFFKLRSFIVPIVNFVSYLGYFGFIVSLIGGMTGYLKLSILILLATVIFQLITLPVELDASKRAYNQLQDLGLIYEEETSHVKKVLSAAAMTYIAGLLSSILNLLRLILILNQSDDD